MDYSNMTRKEYAASKGVGNVGRGRPSKEQCAIADEAEKNGVRFKDSKVVVKVTTDESGKVSETVEKAQPVNFHGPTPAAIYPGNWHAIVEGRKIVVSSRVACMPCGVSLSHHRCSTPEAIVNGAVVAEVVYG